MTPKKLQRSPGRIGGHSIDFWRNGSGVITQNIINGAESSQNSHDKGSGSDEAQSRDSQDYMRQMRLLMERREAELMAWAAAHADDDESIDDLNVFEDSAPHAKSGRRLGPEGTVLIGENASGDTYIETDSEDFAVWQHRRNFRAQALRLEPTIIIGSAQYEYPRRLWNLVVQGREPGSRPLGNVSTELVL
jgi:hypothetical protein